MEYDGGTTTGQAALQHETYHSWWGRGLKPASQPDAWIDEGWTFYYTLVLVRMKKDAALKAELIYIRSLDTSRNALKKRTRSVPEPDIREVEEVLARRQADEAKTITGRIRHEIITSSNPKNLDLLFPAYKVQPFPQIRDARISLISLPRSSIGCWACASTCQGRRKKVMSFMSIW